jgi:hypothetical protein
MKCYVFHFLFFFLQNQRTGGQKQVLHRADSWHQWEGERDRRVNTVQKCVHMYVNARMIPAETVPGSGEQGIKESDRGGEFMCDIFHKF